MAPFSRHESVVENPGLTSPTIYATPIVTITKTRSIASIIGENNGDPISAHQKRSPQVRPLSRA